MAARWSAAAAAAVVIVVVSAALGASGSFLTDFRAEEKERGAVALVTVALRAGGLRKCTGAAVGSRSVLAPAGCFVHMDESKFVEVQLPAPCAKPRKGPPKKVVVSVVKKRKIKRKKAHAEVPLQTRFARHVLRAPGAGAEDERGVVLLRLTAPLEGAAKVPLAEERPPLHGAAPCSLLSWGMTNGVPPEPRLTRAVVRAGNFSACWTRAHAGRGGARHGRLCALADGCLLPGAGAALFCQGALAGLAAPSPAAAAAAGRTYRPLSDPCAGAALALDAAAVLPWLQEAVPDLATAPTGLHTATASTTPATKARRRRHTKVTSARNKAFH